MRLFRRGIFFPQYTPSCCRYTLPTSPYALIRCRTFGGRMPGGMREIYTMPALSCAALNAASASGVNGLTIFSEGPEKPSGSMTSPRASDPYFSSVCWDEGPGSGLSSDSSPTMSSTQINSAAQFSAEQRDFHLDAEAGEYVTELIKSGLHSETSSAHNNRNRRRPGSISITRFGELSGSQGQGLESPNKLSHIAAQSSIYQTPYANMSNSSVASGASDFSNEGAHLEDTQQITRMHQIAGKQGFSKAVNNLLPRRLSRTPSANILMPSSEVNVVIGVSITHSTTQSTGDHKDYGTTVTVSAPGSKAKLSRRKSSISISLIAKAKTFSQKFKRQGKQPSLSENTLPSS